MANLQAYTIDQKEWRGEELDEEQAELDANIAILLLLMYEKNQDNRERSEIP